MSVPFGVAAMPLFEDLNALPSTPLRRGQRVGLSVCLIGPSSPRENMAEIPSPFPLVFKVRAFIRRVQSTHSPSSKRVPFSDRTWPASPGPRPSPPSPSSPFPLWRSVSNLAPIPHAHAYEKPGGRLPSSGDG